MINPHWNNAKKIKMFNESSQVDLDPNSNLFEAAAIGIEEGWEAGPVQSLLNMAEANRGNKYMTPLEANEKFGLSGTAAAFKDGEEKISDLHAERVRERHLDRTRNEAVMEEIENDFGIVGSAANFAGNMLAGIVDPINLAVGVGTGLAFAKMGTMSAMAVAESVASQATARTLTKQAGVTALSKLNVHNTVGKQLAENFVASVAIDAVIVPQSDKVMNQNVGMENRVLNVLGATFLGGAIGTVMEAPSIIRARRATAKIVSNYGTVANKMLLDTNMHILMNTRNGKKVNPNFIFRKAEYEHYSTRPDQRPYQFRPVVTETDIRGKSFYIGRAKDSKGMDVVSGQGDNAVVFSDNRNHVHNRVSSLDGKVSGEVLEVSIDQNLKVMIPEQYDGIKSDLTLRVAQEYKIKTSQLQDAKSIPELKALVMDSVEDFREFKSPNEMINMILRDEYGFDGYHGVNGAATMDESYNFLALFKKETAESDSIASTFGDEINMDKGLVKMWNVAETEAFDNNHPKADDFTRPLKDMEKGEVSRMNDPRQDVGFDDDDIARLEHFKDNPPAPIDVDMADAILAREGIDLAEFKADDAVPDDIKEHIAIIEGEEQLRAEVLRLKECWG